MYLSSSFVLSLLALVLAFQCLEAVKPTFHSYSDPSDKKTCLLVAAKSPITLTKIRKGTVDVVAKKEEINIKNVAVECAKGVAKTLTLPRTDEFQLTFKFSEDATNWLMEPEGTIGHENYITQGQKISVPKAFSFSCQKYEIKLSPKEKSNYYEIIYFTLEGFQIQPFHNGSAEKLRFLDSDDCAVWFTLPIWSSLIVTLLLITILYFGIIALMSISTPDRFENPKGRTLIITNFDE